MTTKKSQLTKMKVKKLDIATDVRMKSANETKTIAFTSKSLAIANLPYKDIKKDRWTRKNGNMTFTVVALREGGKIPYGVIPRLFFVWLITEIVRTKSKEIVLGQHFSDFLTKIGYKEDGGYTRRRVEDQLRRLFDVAIGTYYDDKKVLIGSPPEGFVQDYKIWAIDKKNDGVQRSLFQDTITVKDSFYNEVVKTPVPMDMRIIEALKNSAFKLDIYIWLTYRMFSISSPTEIPYEILMGQFGDESDPSDKKALDNFRTRFRKSLNEVLALYPARVDMKSFTQKIVLLPSKTSVHKIS